MPSSYLVMELARNPDVYKKLLSSLPQLSVCDPLIDSISVRTDQRYDYLPIASGLNASFRGTRHA